jgi:L-ribulose-5-phosphate 3-epimerase
MHPTRRAFTLGAAALAARPQIPAQPPRPAPIICLFSKHLSTIHYADLGGVLKDLGFAGCDLTVRPGGHVEPALSAADLYRAVEAIRGEGDTLFQAGLLELPAG